MRFREKHLKSRPFSSPSQVPQPSIEYKQIRHGNGRKKLAVSSYAFSVDARRDRPNLGSDNVNRLALALHRSVREITVKNVGPVVIIDGILSAVDLPGIVACGPI